MTLVFDCTTYFQEADIWRLRYETLKDVVDGFVVVEARHTHSGAEKPLTFEMPRVGPATIRYHFTDLPDPGVPGIPATRRREMFQRNAIADALRSEDWGEPPPDTILLISDCDEIPRPEAVAALRARGLHDGEVVTFLQRLAYYNFNTISPQPWPGTRAARWADVAALSPHVIRCGLGQPDGLYPTPLVMGNAGWHVSYFGGVEMVKRKMESFLHQELVTPTNTDPAAIAARINEGVDVWGREGGAHGITLGAASDLPPPVAANPQAWRHFFHPEYQP